MKKKKLKEKSCEFFQINFLNPFKKFGIIPDKFFNVNKFIRAIFISNQVKLIF